MVSRVSWAGATSARRLSRWVGVAAVAVVLLMVLPGPLVRPASPVAANAAGARASVVGAGALRSALPTGAADMSGTPFLPPSPGSAMLTAAENSLESGHGPADGQPIHCSVPVTPTISVSCSAGVGGAGINDRPSASGPAAAATTNPTAGLGWAILGVPAGREYATYSMVYDYQDGYVVLFGGSNATGEYMSDTWSYHAGVWTELFPLVSPTARDSTGLAWDGTDNSVLLFGGYSPGTGGYLNDTWLFRGGAWTQLPYKGPTPRLGFGIAWDPQAGYDLLFGGSSPLCANYLCNDSWAFEYNGWTQVLTNWTPTSTPISRYQLMMAYDGVDNYAVMFGGYGGSRCVQGYDCGDTWTFLASHYVYRWGHFYYAGNWSQVASNGVKCGTAAEGPCAGTSPAERQQASMAFDPVDGEIVLFGGWNRTFGYFGDTWTFAGGNWTQAHPTLYVGGRYGEPMTYDAAASDGYLLMLPGGPSYDQFADAFYRFDFGNWSRIPPPVSGGPISAFGATMAYDPVDQYVVYFGGYNYSLGPQNETWTFRGGVWTHLGLGLEPSQRYFAAMSWDPAASQVILFGGYGFSGFLNDTWGFVHGGWTELCAGGFSICNGHYSPSPREDDSLAPLPASSWLVLFGGYGLYGGSYADNNETWVYASGAWYNDTFALSSPAPAPRSDYGMAYDEADQEIVLFGGHNTSTFTFGDTWALSSSTGRWAQVGSCGGPSQTQCGPLAPDPRSDFVFGYDSVDQGIIAGLGLNNNSYYDYSTWLFRAGNWTQCGGGPAYSCEGYVAWQPWDIYGASAYDEADGYTVLRGGYAYDSFGSNQAGTWIFGRVLTAPVTGSSPMQIDNGQSTTLTAGASGGGSGTYNFSWAGIPGGCSPPVAGVATFSCTPLYQGNSMYGGSFVYGTYWVPTVTVRDSSGWPSVVSADTSWYGPGSIEVAPDLSALMNASATTAEVGQTVYVQATVEYDGWSPYTWYWQGFPAGCAVVARTTYTQLVKCVLPASAVGTWQLSVGIVDNVNARVYPSPITLTVESAANASAVTVSRQSLDAGQSVSFSVNPSGGSGTYSYAWTNVPVACLANAPVLNCVVPAGEAGSYVHPNVNITDSLGGMVSRNFSGTVVVSEPPTASALTVSGILGAPVADIDVGQSVTFNLTTTPGAGGNTVVWSGLPAGCAPSGTDASVVTCSPTQAGSFHVSAMINDTNGASATSPTVSLTVTPALGAPSLSASQTVLDVGETLTLAVTTTGGAGGDSFVWSGLPPGCVSSNAPTLSCSPIGTDPTTVKVTVTDANGAGVTASASVSVNARLSASVSLASASTTAPGAASYSAVVSGGTGPYTYEWLENGALVAGATSSTLSLSALSAGTYTVQVIVGDATNATASSAVAATAVTAAPAAAASTPFATSFQWLELGLILVLIALAVIVLLFGRRRSPPEPPVAAVSPPPPPGPEPPPTSPSPGPTEWDESHEPPAAG